MSATATQSSVEWSRPGRSEFQERGFLVERGALAPETIAHLRRRLDDAAKSPPSSQVLFTHRPPPPGRRPMSALMDQWFGRLQTDDAGGALLARLRTVLLGVTGLEMTPFQDVALRKGAHHAPFPWHQDAPFWPIGSYAGAVVWIPLDSVDESNGAVWLAAGSHRASAQPAVDLHSGTLQDGSGEFVVVGEPCCRRLDPGDVLVFDAWCAHRSGINLSPSNRRAWAVSWTDARARWDHARAPRHPLNSFTTDHGEVRTWSNTRYLFEG